MIRILRSKLLIAFLCTLLVLIGYLLLSKNKVIGSNRENIILVGETKHKQKSISEFSNESKKYSYVSFDNLYENTTLYFGSKIFQFGHIKKLDPEDKYMLVALDGNDASRVCKVRYTDSNFARNISSLQEDDTVKFYGEVLSVDNYINEKGRQIRRPVIAANFIQLKINK
ncbi:hypothetical protein [Companilactobacillus bobalius]|uniref:Uncharacterized protein n=2 Tax=Companilactobacillus bobalius TaxID=2801451 RepID=A0A202FFS0_9LACO|nr:hypothetical protein [Companilactobacillus bobalius]KAE9560270.1 hypothetical protein ATN92_08845 [Companilactobacillus bobalius]KRK83004.1 hypothetical protein FC78_GL001810 [Companilactobacillus bobalius DSM 19674]OVE99311.1 hypothetical protein LKACC16343_00423 [Companilactobacillus bobalius]GEO57289.1 hypothetical protein LBO01_04180 [Companilactobacillus paralimentarius]